VTLRALVCGDYHSLLYGEKIPARGVAVMGRCLFDDGKLVGVTRSTPTRPAFDYVVEPRGDSLRIWHEPTGTAA
jgi:hypothetical protein